GERVHAVHERRRHVVAAGVLCDVRHRGDALERGPHAVPVVLAAKDHGQVVDGGHVEGLVEGADVDGRLPEVTDADLVAALVLDRKADARSERDMPADDPVPPHEPLLGVEQVHRAALALRAAGRLPEQLGHHGARRDAADQRLAVLTVGADHVIVVAQRRKRADRHRFLADIEMAEPADLAQRVGLRRLLLEVTDQQHLSQHPAIGRCWLEGRRYWPRVRMSTPWARRSCIAPSSSSQSSPSPQMMPDLVSMAGSRYFTRRSSSRARGYRPPGRASRYSRSMVSRLWFRMSGCASTTIRSARSLPLKSGMSTSTDVSGVRWRIAAMHAAKTSAPPCGRSSRSTLVMT